MLKIFQTKSLDQILGAFTQVQQDLTDFVIQKQGEKDALESHLAQVDADITKSDVILNNINKLLDGDK